MFLIVESKNTVNKYTKNLIKMSKTRVTCGMRFRLAKFYINNYTFLDNFLHFSQRTRYLGLKISIISEFQKNLLSSFLKCGGIHSLSQHY
jgi:hypothetical protein